MPALPSWATTEERIERILRGPFGPLHRSFGATTRGASRRAHIAALTRSGLMRTGILGSWVHCIILNSPPKGNIIGGAAGSKLTNDASHSRLVNVILPHIIAWARLNPGHIVTGNANPTAIYDNSNPPVVLVKCLYAWLKNREQMRLAEVHMALEPF